MLAGSCGFVCQSSYSCVSSICTNTNFGKKLLRGGAQTAPPSLRVVQGLVWRSTDVQASKGSC